MILEEGYGRRVTLFATLLQGGTYNVTFRYTDEGYEEEVTLSDREWTTFVEQVDGINALLNCAMHGALAEVGFQTRFPYIPSEVSGSSHMVFENAPASPRDIGSEGEDSIDVDASPSGVTRDGDAHSGLDTSSFTDTSDEERDVRGA